MGFDLLLKLSMFHLKTINDKLGHKAGVDSCGATLADMAKICAELGMHNAVNLDGGGSAQILLKNIRHLCVSDRNAADYSEAERPVPMGLMVE